MNAVPDQEQPQTCCSNCQTLFEVSTELLGSSDTRVRCGECLSIFDALANLRPDERFHEDDDFLVDADGNIIDTVAMLADTSDTSDTSDADAGVLANEPDHHKISGRGDASAAALAGLGNDTAPLDVTYSDFNLFSEDAGLPEVAYFDQTQDEAAYGYDEDDEDETLSDSLLARDMTVDLPESGNEDVGGLTALALNKEVDFVTSDSPRDPLVFNYRDKEPVDQTAQDHDSLSEIDAMIERVRSGVSNESELSADAAEVAGDGRSWLQRGSLVAVLLAGLLFVYAARDTLFASPVVRPVLSGICTLLPCDIPVHKDISAFRTVKRAAFSHPSIPSALIIDIAFVNEASFSQPHPVLELQLTDVTGRQVVKNNFKPADYLDSWQSGDQLASGERLNVSLTVEDPGRDVTSFVVGFR